MGIFSPTFLLGLVLVLYLISFVFFAILRIATGISIQRIGYFSLKRIAYTPRDGIRIELYGLGLHLHRPTFAQPTWISLRFTELKVTVDIEAFATGNKNEGPLQSRSSGSFAKENKQDDSHRPPPKPILRSLSTGSSRSRTWKRLTQVKERIKQLHDKIHWLRMVDITATDSSLVISDFGQFQIGTFYALVDTRRKTVDRGRLFQHKKIPAGDQRPAEWMFTIKGILFTLDGEQKPPLEVLDICTLNIHGLLYKDRPGLRDTSISLKLGRVDIPYDDFVACIHHAEECQKRARFRSGRFETENGDISFRDVIDELDKPGSREEKIMQTVSDSKEFVSSILRGIQEIQIAVSFVGLTKEFPSIQPSSESPLYLNVAVNEFGIDLHRLDPKSPAHRMYFSSKDIAHQALLAAISLAVSLDDDKREPERILYVPMVTTTVKTTLPSKTVAFSEGKDAAERNANILFANLVVTSPSIDLDPTHMPLLLALLHKENQHKRPSHGRHHLVSRLLPKAHIKLSIHEPVIRVALPPADPDLTGSDDYDLLILSISSISLDVESLHSTAGEMHYALTSNLRVASNQLYYHTAAGERYDLLITDALELNVQLNASPEVSVVATGNLQTFSVHMVRPEISSGVRQIVHQLSRDYDLKTTTHHASPSKSDFLRRLPAWLVQFSLRGSNFGFEVAGVDPEVSQDTRGVALQLESWTADYKIQRSSPEERPPSRRYGAIKSPLREEPMIKITPPPGTDDDDPSTKDGRRLAVHVRSLEGFVVEGIDVVEQEYFVSLPRFEVAFSTSSDAQGPIFHINSHTKSLLVQYSLYRYYAIGVATTVLRKAFARDTKPSESTANGSAEVLNSVHQVPSSAPQKTPQVLTSIDVRADLLQIKAKMPSDPQMMLQVYRMEAGRHRWAMPFLKSQMVRLYAQAPQIPSAWARVVSIKTLRVDLRENRRKRGGSVLQERSIDVATDFVRLAVPHQLVVHKVLDNFVNVMKASEQLHHRFQTGTDEYILKKSPEEPKQVPRVSIRSKAFLFDIEDGPFEWKLGTIYRSGLIEQKQRLAREEAFLTKKQNLENSTRHRESSRYRPPMRRGRSQKSPHQGTRERSSSAGSSRRHRSESPRSPRSRHMRYNPDGKCKLSLDANIATEEAWNRLLRHNAQSWKKRIDSAYRIQNFGMRRIRNVFWGDEDVFLDDDKSEPILAMPERPGLMSTLISDLHIILDKPSFPTGEYPKFLHRIGKGMPYDMQYSLLIPLNVQIDMGEARVTLRDYPLPLLHVPAIRPGQSPRLPSWSLKTDFVIAEEYRGDISSKGVKVDVVPPEKISESDPAKGFAIDVRRTISPVKTYSDVDIAINTSAPTSITWGTSYQPAIQDMMMIIEGFTKPQVDPSDRTGFWDKIRLSAHSRVNVAWKGDGDVRLQLKGINPAQNYSHYTDVC